MNLMTSIPTKIKVIFQTGILHKSLTVNLDNANMIKTIFLIKTIFKAMNMTMKIWLITLINEE